MASPPKEPKRIVLTCPKCSGKSELDIDVDVFNFYRADAVTPEAIKLERDRGPLMCIVFCRRTFPFAQEAWKTLMEKGHPEDRIKVIYAARDEVRALYRNECKLVPIEE